MDKITQIQTADPDHTIIINQTYLANLRRECLGWTDDQLDELLTGVKVVGGIINDLSV